MANKAAKAVKKALQGNNKLTQSEIRNLQSAGIDMSKILTVAGRNSATIGQNARQVYGIDQNKRGVISYSPLSSQGAPKPGSGWAVTGFQSTPSAVTRGQSVGGGARPTYTYMGNNRAGSRTPRRGVNGLNMNGPNDQGPPPPPGPEPTTPTGNWWDGIVEGINGVLSTITTQINSNNTNSDLYMGEIRNLIGQMSAAPTPQTVAPYAVTTTAVDPAQGAQVTQAIGRRPKNLSTSLAITPLETASAGTGLNIPV